MNHFYEYLDSKSKLCVKHKSRGVLLQRADGSSSPFHRTKAAAPISPPPQFKSQILLTGVEFLPRPCDFTWTQVSQCQVWSSTATKLFRKVAARPDARPAGLDSLLSVPWAGPSPHRQRPAKPIQTLPSDIVFNAIWIDSTPVSHGQKGDLF